MPVLVLTCTFFLGGCILTNASQYIPETSVTNEDHAEVIVRERKATLGPYFSREFRAYERAAVGCATHGRIAVFRSSVVLRCSGLVTKRCDTKSFYDCRPATDEAERAIVDAILENDSILPYERQLATDMHGAP